MRLEANNEDNGAKGVGLPNRYAGISMLFSRVWARGYARLRAWGPSIYIHVTHKFSLILKNYCGIYFIRHLFPGANPLGKLLPILEKNSLSPHTKCLLKET